MELVSFTFVIIWAIVSGDKSQEKWKMICLSPAHSFKGGQWVRLLSLAPVTWPCSCQLLESCCDMIWPNSYESYDFFLNLFFNPKYLWTRDIKCKYEGRWPASVLKTSLVHRNSSHILLSKIKLSGFSLSGRLVWNGLILNDLIQVQRWS